jgi:hypothetical protein
MKTFATACLVALSTPVVCQGEHVTTQLIIAESALQTLGYKTLETLRHDQSQWEIKEFGQATITWQSIKGLNELKDWKNAYYRFRIAEETFSTAQEARHRIERIRDIPPGLDTKTDPHWMLRDGIAIGNSAYIASTDSEKFMSEALPSIMQFLGTTFADAIKKRDATFALMKQMGIRLGRKSDIPFVFSPMRESETKDLHILLEAMKEAGIQLAMPDCIDLGMGLWKIAPEDVDRANGVLKRKDLIKTLPTLQFDVREPSK